MSENPYGYIAPVTGEMFYNRSDEIQILLKGFRLREGDSFAIIGGRKMGKTSLILEIQRRLVKRFGARERLLLIPVYLDLNYEVPNSQRSLWISVTRRMLEVLHEYFPKISLDHVQSQRLLDSGRLDEEAIKDFEEVLDQTVSILSEHFSSTRIVLLFDGVHQLLGSDWISTFHSQLRALLSNRPIQSSLAMAMTGSSDLLIATQEKGSPLGNVLRMTMSLTAFGEKNAKELIADPLKSVGRADFLPDSLVQRIYTETGGHPFLIQYIMWHLCNLEKPRASGEDLDSVLQRFTEERKDFNDWHRKLSTIDATVYASFIHAAEPLSQGDILERYVNEEHGVYRALNLLLTTGVIRRVEVKEGLQQRYELAGDLFKNWFTANYMAKYKRLLGDKGHEIRRSVPLVFISYASEDEGKARTVYKKLKGESLKPWIDKENILPGEEWDLKIQEALRESDFLVICLSNKSVTKRGYIQKEIKMALDAAQEMPEGSIFLIPVRLEECRVPKSIARYQYVDLFSSDGFDRLVRAISAEWGKRKQSKI